MTDPTIHDARATLQQAQAARTAGRRMIARGDRPLYRYEVIRVAPKVTIRIIGSPWLTATVGSMRDAPEAARALVVAWLETEPDRFDIEPG